MSDRTPQHAGADAVRDLLRDLSTQADSDWAAVNIDDNEFNNKPFNYVEFVRKINESLHANVVRC